LAALLLVGLGLGSAHAQNPVSTVEDNQGTQLMQLFDNGNLELFQNGALTVPGDIESTGGLIILQDGTTLGGSGDLGLSLPFSGSVGSSSPALELGNTGSGSALTTTSGGIMASSGDIEAASGDFVLQDGTTLSGSGDLGQLSLPFSGSGSVGGANSGLFEVDNTGSGDGLRVVNAGDDGFEVESAGEAGLQARDAANHGVFIGEVGSPSTTNSISAKSAFEVEGVEGNGLSVGRVDGDGVLVDDAASDGVEVQNASYGFYAPGVSQDGVLISSPGDNGVDINGSSNDGVKISNAGDDGIYVSGSTEMAGRFVGSHDDGPILGVENNSTSGNSASDGINVTGADEDGIQVENAEYGVYVRSAENDALLVFGDDDGIQASGDDDGDGSGLAGNFNGDVDVSGTLSKGGGSFKIDHPQDPTGKYLQHGFVESPQMTNIYKGNVTLDASGAATVQLPDYFESVNRDFQYQLTAIGAAAPRLHVAEEVSNNTFRIAGGEPNMKVSWQITAVRDDAYARENRIQVVTEKPADKQGTYRHPEAHGAPQSQGEAASEKREDVQETQSIKQEDTPEKEKGEEQGQ